MIVVSAVGYLADATSTAFVVVGAALVVVAGLTERLVTLKLTTAGFEMTLAARQALALAEKEAEAEGKPDEAQALRRAGEKLDEWYEAYLASPWSRDPNPYTRAAWMSRFYKDRKPEGSAR
jgi:hypothetical protein